MRGAWGGWGGSLCGAVPGGRRGEGTGVEGTDCGGEGRELYHWAEACRGHPGVWWYTTAGVSVKSTRREAISNRGNK